MQKSKIVTNTLVYALLILAFVLFVFPFFLILINSFKTNGQILTNPFSMPTSFSFKSFSEVIAKMNYTTTLVNSVVITVCGVALILVTSAMSAYHMVRNKTALNNTFFSILVASMIIPFQSLMIPLLIIYGAKLKVLDAAPMPVLILLYGGFGSAMSVFIFHGFLKSIPYELEEASFIDGCTTKQTFFQIVLPILRPTAMTILILNSMWIWNDYLLPSLILTKPSQLTMPIQMKVFNGTYMDNWELLIPALLLMILPMLIVYMIAQKEIIQGVMSGSIK
jgi:raffinose/stachyose/melibiose transport system permease protein